MLIANLDHSPDHSPEHRWTSRAKRQLLLALITFFLMVLVMAVVYSGSWLTVITAAGSFLAGMMFMSYLRRISAVRIWPFLARCLDRDKIEARLRELDA